jgi:hypothetical protein
VHHIVDRLARWQREEHHRGRPHHILDGPAHDDAVLRQALQRGRIAIQRDDVRAALALEIAAHRLAHHAYADEPDGLAGLCHSILDWLDVLPLPCVRESRREGALCSRDVLELYVDAPSPQPLCHEGRAGSAETVDSRCDYKGFRAF